MNAVDILTQDHREVDTMIAELEQAGDGGSNNGSNNYQATFERMFKALALHMKAEEEIFYPAVRQAGEEQEFVEEAYDEHNEVKTLLLEMQHLDPASTEFQENLKIVKAGIEHHVSEEEGEMFPDAKELLGDERLNEIGSQITELKNTATPTFSASA